MKAWRVMDEGGESVEPMEEVPLKKLGESELVILVHGWWREARSWFQRRGEAYWKERSVIRKGDDVDGRAWPKMKSAARTLNCDGVTQIWRLGGCENFIYKWKEIVFNALGYFSQCRDRRMGVMWLDLGALTTAHAREFPICYSRVIWDLGRLW